MADKREPDRLRSFSGEMIRAISLDYIVKEMSWQKITKKYKITRPAFYEISRRMNLVKRRDQYRQRVIDKAVERCAQLQSKIVANSHKLFAEHIHSLDVLKRSQKNGMLTHDQIKELVAIMSLISKHQKDKADSPVGSGQGSVTVNMISPVPAISKNNETIDADFKLPNQDTEPPKEVEQLTAREQKPVETEEAKQPEVITAGVLPSII